MNSTSDCGAPLDDVIHRPVDTDVFDVIYETRLNQNTYRFNCNVNTHNGEGGTAVMQAVRLYVFYPSEVCNDAKGTKLPLEWAATDGKLTSCPGTITLQAPSPNTNGPSFRAFKLQCTDTEGLSTCSTYGINPVEPRREEKLYLPIISQ